MVYKHIHDLSSNRLLMFLPMKYIYDFIKIIEINKCKSLKSQRCHCGAPERGPSPSLLCTMADPALFPQCLKSGICEEKSSTVLEYNVCFIHFILYGENGINPYLLFLHYIIGFAHSNLKMFIY